MMGSSPGCSVEGLRRGAWTKEEDMILSQYIQIHGDGGGWTKLPQKAGLKRSGKSCRLRWLNYLRPDIKRGCISPDEEELIIRLHRLLGNRWSLIAGRLPGRTDNEIKNYWNTHLRKNTQSMNEFQPNWKTQKMKIRSKSPPLPQDYVLKPTPFKLTMAAKHSEIGRPVGSNAYGCSNYCSSDEAFELCNVKEATERGAFVMADVNLVEPEGRNSTCAVSSLADEESPNYDHLAGDTATLPESLFESDWTLFSPSGCSIDLGLDEFYRVAAAEMNGFEDIICCDQSNMQSANSFTVADNVGKEEFYYNMEEFLNWVPGVDNNLQK